MKEQEVEKIIDGEDTVRYTTSHGKAGSTCKLLHKNAPMTWAQTAFYTQLV